MLKGFKDFLLRGNVVDLSVAVVMGAAFGGIVSAFTDKIIKPLLNAITPPSSPGLSLQLVAGKPSTQIDFAALITTAINFVMVAVVVYFVIVLPMKTIQQRRRRGEEPGPAEPTDIELLKEIRDLLSVQAGSRSSGSRDGSLDGQAWDNLARDGQPERLPSRDGQSRDSQSQASQPRDGQVQGGQAQDGQVRDGHSPDGARPTERAEHAVASPAPEEPALFTQPDTPVPESPGVAPTAAPARSGSGSGTPGSIGSTGRAIRPIGGPEHPVGPGYGSGTAHGAPTDPGPGSDGGQQAPGGQDSGGGRHSAPAQPTQQPPQQPPGRSR
ncbi:MAG: large conductance mechanosensitive channel [Pseudonocardiales bacterium]|jgi:large conductance mechanosensitive channel|nr:large conductance mechanosensitive channel [Pseudonocardiales bacterium]